MIRLAFGLQACAAIVAIALLATPLPGQVIGLKTVPLAAGDQFLIFPSQNLGMGGRPLHFRIRWPIHSLTRQPVHDRRARVSSACRRSTPSLMGTEVLGACRWGSMPEARGCRCRRRVIPAGALPVIRPAVR